MGNTARFALDYPDGGDAPYVHLDIKQLADDVDALLSKCLVVANLASRPAGVGVGFLIYQTDIKSVLMWDGTVWQNFSVGLPLPVSAGPATGSTIIAGAFAALPNPVGCTFTTPLPVYALVSYSAWLAFSGTLGGDGRVNVELTGATVISSTPPGSPTTVGDGTDWYWGDVLYATGTIAASNQLTATRLIKFNAGTTNIALWAYKLTAVTVTLNYASLRIVPVRWA